MRPLTTMNQAYFDHAASTPLDPSAREAVVRALALTGNPSSIHSFGRACKAVIEEAREKVAQLVGVPASAVAFTSGATEANVLAIRGTIEAVLGTCAGRRPRILASTTEHSSVLEEVLRLEKLGVADVSWINVGVDGVIQIRELDSAMDENVVLVAVQWVNNVTGVVQPVARIGELVQKERAKRGPHGLPIVFACDAVQAIRTIDVRPFAVGIDLCILSAHKMYGPKGIGAIIRRSGAVIAPVAIGGGQEDGLRGGTENLLGIAGFGATAEVMTSRRSQDIVLVSALREAFLSELASGAQTAVHPIVSKNTVPDIVFVAGHGFGELSVLALDAVGSAVSSGSACDAGKRKPSHVLQAMGLQDVGGIRVCFGRETNVAQVRELARSMMRLSR